MGLVTQNILPLFYSQSNSNLMIHLHDIMS